VAGMSSFAGGALVGAHTHADASAPAAGRSAIRMCDRPAEARSVPHASGRHRAPAGRRCAPPGGGVTAYTQPLRRK
jgi:hypothetical protein